MSMEKTERLFDINGRTRYDKEKGVGPWTG